MKSPLVFIVIVSYNGKKHLEFCLPTLVAQDYDNFKIFIADNNSTDGVEEWLKIKFPTVYCMRQKNNIGMGAMNEVLTWPNQNGIEENPKYIFVAGWDLKFEPRTITHSVKAMESNSNVGVLGYDVIGLFEWVEASELDKKVKEWTENMIWDVNWVPGACSFYRKELLDKIGFLDPVYFAYSEEDDIQYRIRKTGFRTVLINTFCWQDAKVGVIPRERATYLHFRNKIRFHTKMKGFLWGMRIAISILNTACSPFVNLDLSLRVNQRSRPYGFLKNLKIWSKAFYWNLKNLKATLKSGVECREKIQKGKIYFNQLNPNRETNINNHDI